jgi:asparagine synthase (glutamine-hydrolysing)
VGKRVLREALARRVGPEIANRRKHGFDVPLARWLRTTLRPMVEDVLGPAAVARRGLFEPAAVSTLVESHLSGRADLSRRVYVLLVLELWLRQFVDERGVLPATRAAEERTRRHGTPGAA